MAKVWYSVQGDGLGHAIRSGVVIEELLKKHKLLVTGCNKSYPYLKKKFGSIVHEIEGQSFVYEDNCVKIGKSLAKLLRDFPKKSKTNVKKTTVMIRNFDPDLIISDFEPTSNYIGLLYNIPVINIDNINVISQCKIKVDSKYNLLYWSTLNGIRLYHPRSDYYLVTTIAQFEPKKDNVVIFPPLLRSEIVAKKPTNGEFVLVYQTTATNAGILHILKEIKEKFVIYGMDKAETDKNITFRQFSESGFINDLKNCKAVIVNGGFTVISEALYYKKPIFALPIKNQFEQMFNGMTIKRFGYGNWSETPDKKRIKGFLSNLKTYEKNLAKIKSWDNAPLFEKLEELIIELKTKNNNEKSKKKTILAFRRKIQDIIAPPTYERTLTIIKPDAVEHGLIGTVIERLEKRGIKPVAMKMIKINRLQARLFYRHLKGKVPDSVFDSIVSYMTSNRVVLIVWQGNSVVQKVRKLCGPTDPKNAPKETIRSLSKDDMEKEFRRGKAVKNIIHSSAKTDEAKKEIGFFFMPWEILKP